MHRIREDAEQPINKKNAQDLYYKYMIMALDTRTKGDRVLFDTYYQRAEYYLHLMNELDPSLLITPTKVVKSRQQGTVLSLPSKGLFALQPARRSTQRSLRN